jgi:predicted nucleic acid-binding protein
MLRKAGFVETQIEELIDSFFNRYKISEFDKNLLIQGSKCSPENSAIFFYSADNLAKMRIAGEKIRRGKWKCF